MGSQRVRQDWATELNWTEYNGIQVQKWQCSLDNYRVRVCVRWAVGHVCIWAGWKIPQKAATCVSEGRAERPQWSHVHACKCACMSTHMCSGPGNVHTWGFPDGLVVKNLSANAGDASSIPRSGISTGEGNSNPLQYSCLENPTDREAWRVTVHGVSKVKCYLKTKQRQQHMCIYACTGKTPPKIERRQERGRLEGWDNQIKRCHLLWQMLKNSSGMVTSQEEDLYDEETNQSSYCRDHSTWDILSTGACLWAWVVSTPRARK